MIKIEAGSPEIPVVPAPKPVKEPEKFDWVAICTAGLILVGGIQGWILWRQEKLMDAQNRPWVGLSNVAYSAMVVGKKLTLTATIKNSGDMPALDMDDCAFSAGLKVPELTVAEIKSLMPRFDNCRNAGKLPLFPDGLFSLDVSRRSDWITQEFLNAIQNGTGYLVIMGRVRYESPDHSSHQTIFCAYYERTSSTFNNCPYGNDAY